MPAHASGLATQTKMVDFAICLGADRDDDDEDSDLDADEPLRDLRNPYRDSLSRRIASVITDTSSSVNHTVSVALRHWPIAISIETKTDSRPREEAQVQLGTWVSAQAHRLRSLALAGGGLPDEAIRLLERIVFPLLQVESAVWTVLFARVTRVAGDGLQLVSDKYVPSSA